MSSFITSKDLKNIREYNRLVSEEGVSSQTAWYRTMNTSSQTAKKLFDDEENLTKVGKSVILSEKAIADASNNLTLEAKAASVGMEALAMAGNLIVSWAVIEVISLIIKGLDSLINAEDKAIEKGNKALSEIQSLNEEIKDINKTIGDNEDKYTEYAKGVSVAGENISLTKEQFEEYHDITNQIAEKFPSMVNGFDAEGNAILKNKGNVEELTNALKDYNKEKAKEAFNKIEDVVEGSRAKIYGSGLFGYGDKFKYEDIQSTLDILTGNKDISKLRLVAFSQSVAEDLGLRKRGLTESLDSYKKYLTENIKTIQDGAKDYLEKINDSKKQVSDTLRNYLQILSFGDSSIAKRYQNSGAGIQSIINNFIDTIDWTSSDFYNFTPVDYQNYLEKNIITPITSLQPELQKELNDFFSKTEITQEDVDVLTNKISGALQNSVKNGLIPQNIAQFLLDFIKNSITTDVSNNTSVDSFNADIDSLTKKIDEIQNVYKTLKDAIKEYNKEGYISVDTFQSIIGLGADYLKYLVDENGNLKLDAQSLQELTIARVKDMVVAQKNKIINMATEWNDESDAAKYLKGNLDETSDSYDDLIEKRLQLLRIKWTEQLDENGNRVWTDEQIENTIAGLRKQFGLLDTVQNAAINGINNGLGMTSESAKDNADKIKDINKQLDDLAKSEALQKLKYKFDQLEQGITKIDTALSLLNNISDLTYEDDYIGKIEIVSNQLDLATSKAQLLQNEFEQLSAEQYDTADSSNELASRMKSTADSIAENQKQIIEYGKNITSYYMSALSAINSLSKNSIERATTLIDRNIKTLSEGGLTGLEFSFAPTVPQSAIEKQRNENQSLKNETQSYYDSGFRPLTGFIRIIP